MKKTFKKVVACVLAVLMMFTMMPFTALANSGDGNNIGWWGDNNFNGLTNSNIPFEVQNAGVWNNEYELGYAAGDAIYPYSDYQDDGIDIAMQDLESVKPVLTVIVSKVDIVSKAAANYYTSTQYPDYASALAAGQVVNPTSLESGQLYAVTFELGGLDAYVSGQVKAFFDAGKVTFGQISKLGKFTATNDNTAAQAVLKWADNFEDGLITTKGYQVAYNSNQTIYVPLFGKQAAPASTYIGEDVRTAGYNGHILATVLFRADDNIDLTQVMHLDVDSENTAAYGCTTFTCYDAEETNGYKHVKFNFDKTNATETAGLLALQYANAGGSTPDPTTYTVNYENYAGTVVSTQTVESADALVAPANTAADAQYSYAWPAVTELTDGMTVKETRTVNQYTVTFTNYAGQVVDTQTLDYGATPVAPANTAADAQYTYAWPTVSAVTGAANYTETRSTNQYTVTFVNAAGDTVSTKAYDYGTAAADVVVPANTETSIGTEWTTTYTWPTVADVTADATYTEVGTPAKTQYTVTFTNYAGQVVDTQTLDYGATPVAPANTASDAQYTYAWPTVAAVTGNADYAETRTVNEYNVTWKFADGRTDQVDTLAYGAAITAPANSSVKVGNVTTTYKWENVAATVTGDVTYTEVVDQQITDAFTVTFVNYAGETVSANSYAAGTAGSDVVLPANTASDAQYTYAWPTVADVTGDVTYTETRTVNEYTVTFVNAAGVTVSETSYPYGTAAEDVDIAENTADTAQYSYSWPEVQDVTGDAVYNEIQEVRNYTVVFHFADGRDDAIVIEPYGTALTAPENSTIVDGYTTTTYKWVDVPATVVDDAEFTEVVDQSTTTQFTVTFVNAAGEEVSAVKYNGGTAAADVAVPENTASTKRVTYSWPEVADVTADVTYNEVVTDLGYAVTVNVADGGTVAVDGNAIDATTTVQKALNSTVALVATPDDGYEFVAWQTTGGVTVSDQATYNAPVLADIEYTPVFAETKASEFTVVFVDRFNNVVDTQTVTNGADIVVPAVPNAVGYTNGAWELDNDAIAALTASTTIKPTYDKDSENTFTVTAAGAKITANGAEYNDVADGIAYDTKVTVSADDAQVWKINGVAVGYGKSYTFFVGANTELTYETAAVVADAAVAGISATPYVTGGRTMVAFLATKTLGEGNTFVSSGFVYGKGCDAESTLDDVDGATVKAFYTKTNSEQFQLNYGYSSQTGTVLVKAFLAYKDASGESHVIYAAPQTYTY